MTTSRAALTAVLASGLLLLSACGDDTGDAETDGPADTGTASASPDGDPSTATPSDPGTTAPPTDDDDSAATAREDRALVAGLDDRDFAAVAAPQGVGSGAGLTLEFDGDEVEGGTCGTPTWTYTVDAGRLVVDPGPAIDPNVRCAPSPASTYLVSLVESEPLLTLVQDRLQVDGAEASLVLREVDATGEPGGDPTDPVATDLTGTSWDLVSVSADEDGADPLLAVRGESASLSFTDGDAVVRTGCNQGGLLAPVSGDTIDFTLVERDDAGCSGALAAQEDAMLELLDDEVTYAVQGGTLTLTGDDGAVMTLSAAR